MTKIYVNEQFTHIVKENLNVFEQKFNTTFEIISINQEQKDSKLPYGHQFIINKALEFENGINAQTDDVIVSISYGVGNFSVKNMNHFVFIYYIQISRNDVNVATFSNSFPFPYELVLNDAPSILKYILETYDNINVLLSDSLRVVLKVME